MTQINFCPILFYIDPKNAYARMEMILRANILEPKQYHSVVAKSFMLIMLVRRLVVSPSNRMIIIRRIFCKILGRKVPKVGVTFYPEMYGHIGGTNAVDFHSYLPLFAQNFANSHLIFRLLLFKTWQTKNPSISREAGIICWYSCYCSIVDL